MRTDQEKLKKFRLVKRKLEEIELKPKRSFQEQRSGNKARESLQKEFDELILEIGYIFEVAGRLRGIATGIKGVSNIGREIQDALFHMATDLERGRVDLKGTLSIVETWLGYADRRSIGDRELVIGVFGCVKNVLNGFIHAV